MKLIKFKLVKESEVPTNTVGSGQIASAGIGLSGEPPKKALKLPMFKRKSSDNKNAR